VNHFLKKPIIPARYNLTVVGILTILIFGTVYWLTPKRVDLLQYERSVFSQSGEDGVLDKIFEIIKPTTRFAVEFGAGDGVVFSNVRNLIVNKGWNSFMIEGDDKLAAACSENYLEYPKAKCLQSWVYPGNIELLFEENGVPKDLDLLVIDIDSNDWYVWRAIHNFHPKVVQIEYNGMFAPPNRVMVDYHPMNYWDYSFYYGASIQSMFELGKKKGYELIYANEYGINLFFVQKKYFKRFGIKDNSPQAIYRPHMGKYMFTSDHLRYLIEGDGMPAEIEESDLVWENLRIKKKYVFDR
jgi:hypothetical protein